MGHFFHNVSQYEHGVSMVVQQSTTQRNQRIAAKSLYATLGFACSIEIYGLLHQQQLSILSIEYSIVYAASFVLAFTFVWLTAKRNVRIAIAHSGLEISHDEDAIRFAWHEVKRVKLPVMLRRYWLFELKNTKRIKIHTHYFSRQQLRQFNRFVTQAVHTIRATTGATNSRISHPRIYDSNHR